MGLEAAKPTPAQLALQKFTPTSEGVGQSSCCADAEVEEDKQRGEVHDAEVSDMDYLRSRMRTTFSSSDSDDEAGPVSGTESGDEGTRVSGCACWHPVMVLTAADCCGFMLEIPDCVGRAGGQHESCWQLRIPSVTSVAYEVTAS